LPQLVSNLVSDAETIGERHAAGAATALECPNVPANVAAPDADPLRLPVEIAPAQSAELAQAQTGHRGGKDHPEALKAVGLED
jgi:hypothetical protein